MKIISRKDAKEQGLKHFYIGEPCNHGHYAKRLTKKGTCLDCKAISDKKCYEKNIDKRKEYTKNYYKENREYKLAYAREYNEKNSDKVKIYHRERYWADPEKARQEKKDYRKRNPNSWNDWYANNKEHRDAQRKEYRERNKEEILERERIATRTPEYKAVKNANRRRKRKESPVYRMECRARDMLYRTLQMSGNKKSGKTYEILGYTPDELKNHVESLLLPNMEWENTDWHLDHLIPISRYLSQGIEDVSIINSLNNLAPMWAEHNLDKRDKTLSEWLLEKGVDSEEYSLYSKYLNTPIDKAS